MAFETLQKKIQESVDEKQFVKFTDKYLAARQSDLETAHYELWTALVGIRQDHIHKTVQELYGHRESFRLHGIAGLVYESGDEILIPINRGVADELQKYDSAFAYLRGKHAAYWGRGNQVSVQGTLFPVRNEGGLLKQVFQQEA